MGTVGTLCSGSDCIMVFFENLAEFAKSQYGVGLPVKQRFACESDDDKMSFILQFHSPEFVFGNTCGMAEQYSKDLKAGSIVVTPGADIAKEFVGCVADKTGKTGESFSEGYEHVKKYKPKMVFLENVAPLMETPKGGGQSDAAYIATQMMEAGYVGKWFEVQAAGYGSFACRKRLYYVGFLDGPDWGKQASEFRLRQMGEMLTLMKVSEGCVEPSDFLLSDADLAARPAAAERGVFRPGQAAEKPQKGAKASSKPEKIPASFDLHNEYYKEKFISWPPVKCTCFDGIFDHLTDRECQLLYFISNVFQNSSDSEGSRIAFADLNLSMKFMCPKDKTGEIRNSPWKPCPSTFVGSMKVVMRYLPEGIEIDDSPCAAPAWEQWKYRLLTGVEYMAIVGWCYKRWGEKPPDSALLTDLAGNAFSLFAAGPIVISAFAASVMPPPPVIDADAASAAEGLAAVIDDSLAD
ncbi:unnamed protein product [Prorocentrum cordatum]|uniref:DNA (cytosine-5-)-methyltransferase n=1 Tax=Prorocentrum cordatum TaxID=2364126 RepID=A0ABN9STE0_9DINO|nr:unnamed protein product [Polarella glacialis]